MTDKKARSPESDGNARLPDLSHAPLDLILKYWQKIEDGEQNVIANCVRTVLKNSMLEDRPASYAAFGNAP